MSNITNDSTDLGNLDGMDTYNNPDMDMDIGADNHRANIYPVEHSHKDQDSMDT